MDCQRSDDLIPERPSGSDQPLYSARSVEAQRNNCMAITPSTLHPPSDVKDLLLNLSALLRQHSLSVFTRVQKLTDISDTSLLLREQQNSCLFEDCCVANPAPMFQAHSPVILVSLYMWEYALHQQKVRQPCVCCFGTTTAPLLSYG